MRGARPTELRRGPHVSLDFDVPPFRPDPDTVARPMPIWRGADPAMLLRGTAYDGQKLRAVARLDQQGTSVWVMEVHRGYEAVDAWETFDARYPQTGLWPVIATDRTCADVADPIEQRYRLGRVDADPVTEDGRSWLYDEFASLLRREGSNEDLVARQDQDWSPAEFARVEENFRNFDWIDIWATVGHEYGHRLLVPAPYPWLVPGRLGWVGACNYGIGWRDHARILRRWQHLWRVDLVAIDRDTIWLRHMQPITDRNTALAAAMEAFLYCSDTVGSDHQTLDNLAKWFLEPMWRLWWD